MSPVSAQPRMTLQEAARLTDLAMDACNLSGLAHDFSRVMDAAWDEVNNRGGGTANVNAHPLAVLWLVKMAELAGLATSDSDDRIHRAFTWLRQHAAQ